MDELLQRAHKLEEAALATIFDTYYRPIYRYIYYHTRHAQTAEDLTAKVFHKLLESLHVGRGPCRHLRAWLFRVAHNLVVDESRRLVHRNHQALNEGWAAQQLNVEDDVHNTLLTDQVREAMTCLTSKQRSVIVLRFLEGLDNAEIAQILKLSVGAVKALQHRALATLRRQLAEGEMI